jgi:hypothetical protein
MTRGAKAPVRRKVSKSNGDSPRQRPAPDEIARRAYELFLERGGAHGQDWQDWLIAERQLSSLDS